MIFTTEFARLERVNEFVSKYIVHYARNVHGWLTLDDLESYEVIAESHADNLIIEDGDDRVWLSRVGVSEGEWCDHKVTVEILIDGRWVEVLEYEAR